MSSIVIPLHRTGINIPVPENKKNQLKITADQHKINSAAAATEPCFLNFNNLYFFQFLPMVVKYFKMWLTKKPFNAPC